MQKRSAVPRGGRDDPFAGIAIIKFGIACCAFAMAVVLAVALRTM